MHLLASITGLSAGWLAAAALASASPILAHLLARRPRRRIVLPTLRFMASAADESARARRLRRRVLLATRALALACLALAFATPTWTAPVRTDAPTDGPTVYVLDASASMQRVSGGRTLFERARDRVRRELASSPGSGSAVVVASGEPRALLPRLSTNTDALLDALALTEPTDQHANLVRAVATARAIPSVQGELGPRRVVLVTDAQSTAFEGLAPGAMETVELVRVGPANPMPNGAITELALSPANPVAGARATLMYTVANFSERESTVQIAIRVGGALIEREVRVPPWASASGTVETGPLQLGATPVSLAIPGDAMPLDDCASLEIDAARAHTVGVLTPPSSPLASAIIASLEHTAKIDPSARQIDTPSLVVAGTDALPDQTLATLDRFIREGGAALWIVGTAAEADLLARLPVAPGEPPIIRSVDLRDAPKSDPGPALSRTARLGSAETPSGYEDALRATSFTRRTIIETDRPARILASFDGGDPFLQQLTLGQGTLTLMGASLDPASSNMIASPLFPLTVNAIVGTPEQSTRRIAASLDPRESDPRFTESFDQARASGAPEAARSTELRSTELWPFLLLTACALLALESVIDARGARAARTPSISPLGRARAT